MPLEKTNTSIPKCERTVRSGMAKKSAPENELSLYKRRGQGFLALLEHGYQTHTLIFRIGELKLKIIHRFCTVQMDHTVVETHCHIDGSIDVRD